jgi:antitoxin component HigA of HigAB toxin-antitoxin module
MCCQDEEVNRYRVRTGMGGKSRELKVMPAVFRKDNREYENLIRKFPLRPIRNEVENERAAATCDELTDRLDRLTTAERDYLEVLSDLVAKFESRWDGEVAKMSARELISYLMEVNELAQEDVVSEFGSASRVSEFLGGQRESLSLGQARKLAKRFSLDVSALVH